jgi:hypothetical protein
MGNIVYQLECSNYAALLVFKITWYRIYCVQFPNRYNIDTIRSVYLDALRKI